MIARKVEEKDHPRSENAMMSSKGTGLDAGCKIRTVDEGDDPRQVNPAVRCLCLSAFLHIAQLPFAVPPHLS